MKLKLPWQKGVPMSDLDVYLREAQGQEITILDLQGKLVRVAWVIAGIAITGMFGALAVAYKASSTPAPVPRVLVMDRSTGAVEEIGPEAVGPTTVEEVKDIFQLNAYVLRCETYDWATLQTDYGLCELWSSGSVWKAHHDLIEGPTGDGGMLKTVKDSYKVVVNIKTVTPDVSTQQAVVRFDTQKVFANGVAQKPEAKIATVAYSYQSLQLTAQQRRDNPWGFQVDSYRVDPETVSQR
jgi:type IV secretion system protein VirB8